MAVGKWLDGVRHLIREHQTTIVAISSALATVGNTRKGWAGGRNDVAIPIVS